VEALETYLLARQRNGSVRYLYYPDGHADFLWAMPDGAPFAQASCGTPRFSASQKALMPVRLAAYRQLAELSRAHGFKAVVWIAPLNRWENTGLLADPDFAQFLRQLHAIANLTVVEPDWNSALLADFHAWHDCGHFRREVFDQLLAPSISKQLVANRGD
jgi:hypothetical protein